MPLLGLRDRLLEQLLQDLDVDIPHLADVKATLAHLMPAQPRQEFLASGEWSEAVETDVAFARSKS